MLKSLLLFLRKSFTTNLQLKLEVIFLTKQLEIYQRTNPKLKISRTDRIFFSLIMYWLYNWKERIFIVKPETIIKWHRTAFKFTGDGSLSQKEEDQRSAGKLLT
jgi:putative transposase